MTLNKQEKLLRIYKVEWRRQFIITVGCPSTAPVLISCNSFFFFFKPFVSFLIPYFLLIKFVLKKMKRQKLCFLYCVVLCLLLAKVWLTTCSYEKHCKPVILKNSSCIQWLVMKNRRWFALYVKNIVCLQWLVTFFFFNVWKDALHAVCCKTNTDMNCT